MCKVFLGNRFHLHESAVLGLNMPETGPNPPVLWNTVTSQTSVKLCFVLLSILPYHFLIEWRAIKLFQAPSSRQRLSPYSKANKNQASFFQIVSSSKDVWKIIFLLLFLFVLCFTIAPIKNTLPMMLGIEDCKVGKKIFWVWNRMTIHSFTSYTQFTHIRNTSLYLGHYY